VGVDDVAPLGELSACLGKDEVPERVDEVGLLGEGNELVGWDVAVAGVVPAQECFGADHPPAAPADVVDTLVVHFEFAARDGVAQVAVQPGDPAGQGACAFGLA
jgi:hypothetical protein